MSSRDPESESFEWRDGENQRLREEIMRLRRLLAAHGIAVPPSASEAFSARPRENGIATQPVSGSAFGSALRREQIAIFRSTGDTV